MTLANIATLANAAVEYVPTTKKVAQGPFELNGNTPHKTITPPFPTPSSAVSAATIPASPPAAKPAKPAAFVAPEQPPVGLDYMNQLMAGFMAPFMQGIMNNTGPVKEQIPAAAKTAQLKRSTVDLITP